MKQRIWVLMVLAALLFGGCAAGIKPFPLTDEAISSLATSGGCLKVKDIVNTITEQHKAPAGTPLHNNLSKDWGIDSEERYVEVLTKLNELTLSGSCKVKAPEPTQSATTSTTTATPSATVSTSSASAASPVLCWGTLQKRLGESDWKKLLDDVDHARGQLKFNSSNVKEWAKLDVDCRVIMVFDDKKTATPEEEKVIRDLASKQVGAQLKAETPIVHAKPSVQLAGGPRVQMSSGDQVRVILPLIVGGRSVPTSGVELTEALSLTLVTDIQFPEK